MPISELLSAGAVVPGLAATTKSQAIETLVDQLIHAGALARDARREVLDAILARERSMSTGTEHGVALPHGSTNAVDRVVCALGIAPNGVPFDSIDGQPARLILLLVLPRTDFPAHVRTLAGAAKLLAGAPLRRALLACQNADDVLETVRVYERQDDVPRAEAM